MFRFFASIVSLLCVILFRQAEQLPLAFIDDEIRPTTFLTLTKNKGASELEVTAEQFCGTYNYVVNPRESMKNVAT